MPLPGSIDVWWSGRTKNGPLMLLLAHLLAQNHEWRSREIRLLLVISAEVGQTEAAKNLHELIETSRIEATPIVVVADDVSEAIRRTSSGAAIVFLGFELPAEGKEAEFVASMNRLVGNLQKVVFVYSAGGMALDV